MENKIIVNIENDVVELSTDLPNIEGLVEAIIKNRHLIKLENIKVQTSEKDFDREGFEKLIRNSVKNFLDNIIIDQNDLKTAIESLNQTE